MKTIKQRAHKYAVAHNNKSDGVSLMRAYIAGAESVVKPTVFISGKVSGLPYMVAYGKFSNAERRLSTAGYKVINPCKICKEKWSWLRCMIKCLWCLTWCDGIYQLKNWQDSRGARIEYKWAKLLRKEFL